MSQENENGLTNVSASAGGGGRPIGIDLFSGVGGLSLGFEQAGFDIAAAVELDPVHAAAHHFNFPDCTIIPESVSDLTGEAIRRKAGIGERPVDVVFGGAPCQGFSLIGQRSIDDPRNNLVKEFVRIVDELDARFFVFENVRGLTVGRQKRFLEELISVFQSLGYDVTLPWRVLNAASLGVPQDRERLFLMGAKSPASPPQYPTPFSAPGERGDFLLTACPTCFDALGDLPDAEEFDALLDSDNVKVDDWGASSAYGAEMRCEHGDAWHFGYRRSWDRSLLTASRRTAHTAISRNRFRETPPGSVEPVSRFYKLKADGVANTLRAGTDSARGAFTSPRPIHYRYPRCVTVREMGRLHGFPDWFRFHVTKWHGARQIGNAVPPPLARAVAGEIMKVTARRPSKPRRLLRLGEERLLRMDMSEAAAFWGVDVRIGRRDRKSGLKKRKQSEIEALRLAQ